MKKTIAIICCLLLPAVSLAQEACSEEDKTLLETCLSDAKTTCEATYPGCEPDPLTPEEALDLLEEKCGACADAKNFGKFNSCLKKLRNALRGAKTLSEEISASLATMRSDCKAEQKEKKKGNKKKKKNKGNNEGDDS